MEKALNIVKTIATQSNSVILFHSASGKDSIALLDLLYPYFERIICVYMYVVPNLDHINRYISFAQKKYPKAKFIQVPHYALFSYYQTGYMGCKKRGDIRKYNLSELTEIIRQRFAIEWVCFGFKMADGMNRRIMLRTYEQNAINRDTCKFYPLSEYKNDDILQYIEAHNLIRPEKYGDTRSMGTNISDVGYLTYLRNNYPQDLKKIIAEFPMVERTLYEYDYKATKAE